MCDWLFAVKGNARLEHGPAVCFNKSCTPFVNMRDLINKKCTFERHHMHDRIQYVTHFTFLHESDRQTCVVSSKYLNTYVHTDSVRDGLKLSQEHLAQSNTNA